MDTILASRVRRTLSSLESGQVFSTILVASAPVGSFDGEEVTNSFSADQHGLLTPAGTQRLRELVAEIDPAAIPDHFEGEARSQDWPIPVREGFFETACELHLDLRTQYVSIRGTSGR